KDIFVSGHKRKVRLFSPGGMSAGRGLSVGPPERLAPRGIRGWMLAVRAALLAASVVMSPPWSGRGGHFDRARADYGSLCCPLLALRATMSARSASKGVPRVLKSDRRPDISIAIQHPKDTVEAAPRLSPRRFRRGWLGQRRRG